MSDNLEAKRRDAYVWWNSLSPSQREDFIKWGDVVSPDDIVYIWAIMYGQPA